jgi:membrane-associated phospholipid phosphatase
MASDRHWQLGLRTVTDLGDAAILIPLAAAILVWLLLDNARCAAWWAGASLFCVGLTAALKIDFHGCPPAPDLHSPSGHTGLSVLVYGAITLAAAQEQRGPRWVLVIIAGGGLIAAIAASRLLLGVHSLAEIGLGLVIGLVSVALFGRVYRRVSHRPVWPLLIAAGVLAAMLHGRELRAEEFLARLTGYFGIHC